MDSDLIKLCVASFCLGLVIAYAWWTKVRVLRLRQHLFAIRDEMWDSANRLGQLDDPAHREYRDVINATIYCAGTITPITIIYCGMLIRKAKTSFAQPPKPLSAEIEAIIAKAKERVNRRMVKYLTRETLSGLMLGILLCLIPKRLREAQEKDGVGQALMPMPAVARCL